MAIESVGVPVFVSGPAGPATVTTAAGLADVVLAIKAVLTAADLPTARTALGLGNVANLAPADLPVSTATSAAIASLATLVMASQTTLNTILGGANPAVDTFIEAYNRFLADESAATAMLAQVTALQAALGGKAAAGANNDITSLGQISAILDAAFGSARGTVAVRGSAGWSALPLGGSGATLQSNGTDLVYAAASPGAGALRYDIAQNISLAQRLQARQNAGDRGAGVLAKSAAYAVLAADIGSFIACTGSFALTLLAASAAGNGFALEVKNAGTGVIALTPASGDAIDGLTAGTALKIYPGECCTLLCDGTAWRTFGLAADAVLLSDTDVSGASVAAFTRFDPARFSAYRFAFSNLAPGTGNTNLLIQASSDGGATYPGGYAYAFQEIIQNGTTRVTSANANSVGVLTSGLAPSFANEGEVLVIGASAVSRFKASEPTAPQMTFSAGAINMPVIPNAVRFYMSGGSFTSGRITMHGVR